MVVPQACSLHSIVTFSLTHLTLVILLTKTGGTGGLKSAAMFSQLKGHVAANPDIVKKVKAIFQWNITKDGETAAKWSKPL